MEFDIWKNHCGKVCVTEASKQFVDNSDAPYGFAYHEQRVTAENKKQALSIYRKQ